MAADQLTGGQPDWTREQWEHALRVRFGPGRGGRVNTAAVAAAAGVSRRTVQRWLAGRIPPARAARLAGLVRPSVDTLAREATTARAARRDLAAVTAGRGMGLKQGWVTRRWTEPHIVAVVDVPALGVRQVTTARAGPDRTPTLTRRGEVVDLTVVPSRFHATVLAHQVLADVDPWRVEAGAGQVAQGLTQVWLADAPATHLARTAEQLFTPPGGADGGLADRKARRARRSRHA